MPDDELDIQTLAAVLFFCGTTSSDTSDSSSTTFALLLAAPDEALAIDFFGEALAIDFFGEALAVDFFAGDFFGGDTEMTITNEADQTALGRQENTLDLWLDSLAASPFGSSSSESESNTDIFFNVILAKLSFGCLLSAAKEKTTQLHMV